MNSPHLTKCINKALKNSDTKFKLTLSRNHIYIPYYYFILTTLNPDLSYMNIPEKADINQALLAFLKTTIVEKDVEILAQTPFRQLGVDSLSIIELVLFIERRFQVVIPEDELTPENLNSVESLTACTVRHLPK